MVAAPTGYQVSIAGMTTTGVPFASFNRALLVINPGPSITAVQPDTGEAGQTVIIQEKGEGQDIQG